MTDRTTEPLRKPSPAPARDAGAACSFTLVDRHGVLARLQERDRVVLELGCGTDRAVDGAITIDRADLDTVDVRADLDQGLPFLPDASVDEIHSFHFLEHVPDLGRMMAEIHRVLKPGGFTAGTVPHFANPYFHSDYTHVTSFGLYSFCYFAQSTEVVRRRLKRPVPTFYNTLDFEIEGLELVFTSPFRIRRQLNRVLQKLVNLGRYTRELHEECFTWILPPYEIDFRLRKPSG